MSWKITLGKPGDTYIIGKRWVKKNIPKKNRTAKVNHKESCPGAIYDLGERYLPDSPNKLQHLWVCLETGTIIKKKPSIIAIPKPKPKKIKPVEPKKPKKKPTPVKKAPEPVPEPKPIPKPKVVAKAEPKFTKDTSVNEVKGVGKAAFDKLSSAGITTLNDLLSKHSQEIATLIGRKSDAQIKKWQDTALAMLE
ncbi:MAG: hypothetical protein ACXAB2_06495 [Candidatus Hodarchaeales archaeon]